MAIISNEKSMNMFNDYWRIINEDSEKDGGGLNPDEQAKFKETYLALSNANKLAIEFSDMLKKHSSSELSTAQEVYKKIYNCYTEVAQIIVKYKIR